MTIEDRITNYRNLLVEIAWKEYCSQARSESTITEEFIRERVAALFPDCNFYFFKDFQLNEDDHEAELEEVRRLIVDNIAFGKRFICEGLYAPVILDVEFRDKLLKILAEQLTSLDSALERAQATYTEATKGQS